MTFLHPYIRYGLAFVMLKENIMNIDQITSKMLRKYIEEGLSHFRMSSPNNPESDEILKYDYINMQTIIEKKIKGDPNKGVYLCPNIIATDIKAGNTWLACESLFKKLELNPDLFNQTEKLTMGISPIAGEINNGTKSKKNATGSILEAACCAITNTTHNKPYLAYKEKGGKLTPTSIIPDLELPEMKTFIKFYNLMIDKTIDNNKLLTKKVYRKEGIKSKFSRPLIYNGNFPFAPQNSAFGIVGMLGAIGRWSKEAGYIEQGREVLNSLVEKPLYLIQYGKAQSVTINHYIIDLAKDNKLSEIVYSIQNSKLIHPFEKGSKGAESRNEIYYLFSSRYLQLFNEPSFKDFLSVRAEYSSKLIELFNIYFEKQMSIRKEIVHSVKTLGLWLNYVAYKVGKLESENQKKPDILWENKAKELIKLESSVFGARKPAEILNVIVIAGRLSGMDAPSESDIFQEAVLTEEITMDEAKSMLMAFARTRSPKILQEDNQLSKEETKVDLPDDFEDENVIN